MAIEEEDEERVEDKVDEDEDEYQIATSTVPSPQAAFQRASPAFHRQPQPPAHTRQPPPPPTTTQRRQQPPTKAIHLPLEDTEGGFMDSQNSVNEFPVIRGDDAAAAAAGRMTMVVSESPNVFVVPPSKVKTDTAKSATPKPDTTSNTSNTTRRNPSPARVDKENQ